MKAIEEEGRASAVEADIRHAALLKRLEMSADAVPAICVAATVKSMVLGPAGRDLAVRKQVEEHSYIGFGHTLGPVSHRGRVFRIRSAVS